MEVRRWDSNIDPSCRAVQGLGVRVKLALGSEGLGRLVLKVGDDETIGRPHVLHEGGVGGGYGIRGQTSRLGSG